MTTLDQLRQQREQGFRALRFQPELEQAYQAERRITLQRRARPVAVSALLVFLLYVLIDLLMFPAALAHQVVLIRLLLTCPAILLVWWLSYRPQSRRYFLACYAGAYLIGGFSVIAIIALARRYPFPIPYEGLLLILMFGYFVMGMPFRSAAASSTSVALGYLLMEYLTGMAAGQLLFNSFFALTVNLIGMIGSWLSEHRHRAHFLDRRMLELMRQQAELENRRKSDLITAASHDLRQPLSLISLTLENLSLQSLPARELSLVDRLRDALRHFNTLLDSVLDMSRIQQGLVQPQPETLNSADILLHSRNALWQQAEQAGVTLTCAATQPALLLRADPALLHRILQNLISNALQHSGATEVRLSSHADGEHVVLRVADNGRGLPATILAHIFEPFFRHDCQSAGAGNHATPGLGLGLAIVHDLSRMMGGRCAIRSTPGAGSSFDVRLPAADQQQAG